MLIVGDEDQPSVFAAAGLLEKELPNVRKAIMHGTAHVPETLVHNWPGGRGTVATHFRWLVHRWWIG